MRFLADFAAHPRMAEFYGELVSPGEGESWEEHAVGSHITYNHATGTCRLGPADDPLAVVGPDLRVHGLDNLWLADMSVIPVIPHAPTNLTAYLVGAIAARNLAAAG
jgi:choline dehydrogenase